MVKTGDSEHQHCVKIPPQPAEAFFTTFHSAGILCCVILKPALLLKLLYHRSSIFLVKVLWRDHPEPRLSAADVLSVPDHLNSKGRNWSNSSQSDSF